jgi:hypothetical protein
MIIDCTTQQVQGVESMPKRKTRKREKEKELTVIVVRPANPNLEALESVYQILATCKLA